jgi:hypothetical protein
VEGDEIRQQQQRCAPPRPTSIVHSKSVLCSYLYTACINTSFPIVPQLGSVSPLRSAVRAARTEENLCTAPAQRRFF